MNSRPISTHPVPSRAPPDQLQLDLHADDNLSFGEWICTLEATPEWAKQLLREGTPESPSPPSTRSPAQSSAPESTHARQPA